jgi:hypothetical protein
VWSKGKILDFRNPFGQCYQPGMMKIPLMMLVLITSAFAEKPTELESLRSGWKEARIRALEPVDRKYLAALETLKARLTKAGDLDGAVKVGKEIEAVSVWFSDSSLDEKRIESRWKWGSGGTLTLMSDGKARHSAWSGYGAWSKLKNGNLVIQSSNGTAFLAVLDSSGSGVVTALDGSGTTSISLK